ncbi:thiamine phosphate synthase [Hydrocarboniphaga effusa]|uniref:thiamine phosphate synthase n=2 Tax=Hydrocarboniphaga effusa TaxID=243629 RepID=UPI0035B0A8EC
MAGTGAARPPSLHSGPMSTLSGLYAITSASLCADESRLIAGATAALEGGARLLQYRDKGAAPARRERLALQLRGLCARHGCRFIVNDDVELAIAIEADGVHLGRGDGSVRRARERLGERAIIGVSCSGSIERAVEAQAEGASYVAFGRFYPSSTKPDAPPAQIETLRQVRGLIGLPVCAIGGITADNAAPLIEAGADMIAAVEGIFGAADIRAEAARYAALFHRPFSAVP